MKKSSKFLICELLLFLLILTGCASGRENDTVESLDSDNLMQITGDEQSEIPVQTSGQETSDSNDIADNLDAVGQEMPDNQDVAGQEASDELSDEELDSFTYFVNSIENYGFLLSKYTTPADIDLNEVFYCGAGISETSLTDDERAAYEQKTGWSIELDVERLTTKQINDFLLEKTGYTLEKMNKPLTWTYLEQYDSYIGQHGDTNYLAFICTGGKGIGEDVVEIHYQSEWGGYEGVLALRKSGDNYLFVSNQDYVVSDQDYEPDLSGLSEDVISQLEVFAANKEVWNMNEYEPLTFRYAVFDLDNDGRLELITSVIAGTGQYSENHFYRTDDMFTKIEELPQEYYDGYSELDIFRYDDDLAYTDGEVIYYSASDYAKNGVTEHYNTDGAYYVKDGIVYSVIYRSDYIFWKDEDNSEQTWYDAAGNEITREAWEKLYDDFFAGMESITYRICWSSIVPSELEQTSERKILGTLAENYKDNLKAITY